MANIDGISRWHAATGLALLVPLLWGFSGTVSATAPAGPASNTTELAGLSEQALAEELLAKPTSQLVDHIPGVFRIERWQALGTRHVLLDVDATRRYLLTLSRHCHQLNWAQSVDVSRSGNDIWSQFDYVNADGWRCNINTIHELHSH